MGGGSPVEEFYRDKVSLLKNGSEPVVDSSFRWFSSLEGQAS